MKTELEILKEVKSLLRSEEFWTKEAFARKKEKTLNGVFLRATNPIGIEATQFCLVGALARVLDLNLRFCTNDEILKSPVYLKLMHEVTILPGQAEIRDLMEFNDEREYVDVIGVVDRAISSCELELKRG